MSLPQGIAAILALAAPVAAQPAAQPVAAQPAAQQSRDPVIRVSVNLAQTDVVVTDSAGRPVTDLEAHDFQLSEDGKPQTITNFSWVEVVPSTPTRPATVRNTAGGMPPASIARREDLRRAIVLMVARTHPISRASAPPPAEGKARFASTAKAMRWARREF